jgi:hypothetical protein
VVECFRLRVDDDTEAEEAMEVDGEEEGVREEEDFRS